MLFRQKQKSQIRLKQFAYGKKYLARSFQIMDDNKLLGLYRAEFQRAEKLSFRAHIVQLCIVLMSGASILFPQTNLVYLLSIVSVVTALIGLYLAEQSSSSHSIAERARRALVIRNGLGIKLSSKSYSDLMMAFKAGDKASDWEDHEYYKSASEHGNRKLAEIIEESAFWSKHLLNVYVKEAWLWFGLVLVIAIITLLMLPLPHFADLSKTISQIVCVVLMWLITGSLFSKAIKLTSCFMAISSIEERLNSNLESNDPLEDIIIHMGDYNSIMQGTPIIPSRIYSKHKNKLNELWKERAMR